MLLSEAVRVFRKGIVGFRGERLWKRPLMKRDTREIVSGGKRNSISVSTPSSQCPISLDMSNITIDHRYMVGTPATMIKSGLQLNIRSSRSHESSSSAFLLTLMA